MFRIYQISISLMVMLWASVSGLASAQNPDSADVRTPDPEQFFYGAYSQVNLTQTEGWPFRLPEIRINGKLDKKPLVLVDGMEGSLIALDMKDVVSIEVLSDPVDIAPYGYKGIYGVVKVTTKSDAGPSAGRPFSVSYTGSASIFSRTVYPKISFDLQEWADVLQDRNELYSLDLDTRFDQELLTARLGLDKGTDWEREQFNKVFFGTSHRVALAGGGKKVQYDVTGNFMSQGGIYVGRERYDHAVLHAGLTAKPFKWWTIRNIVGYSYRKDGYPVAGNDIEYHSYGLYDALSVFGYPYAVPKTGAEYTDEARGCRVASMMNRDDYLVSADSRFQESLLNTFTLYKDSDAHDLRLNLGMSLQWNHNRSLEEHEVTRGDKSYDEMSSLDVYRGDINLEYDGHYAFGWNLNGRLGFEAYHFRQTYEDQFVSVNSGIQETVDRSYGYKQDDYRQYLSLDLNWRNRYALSFAQSHDAVANDECAVKRDRDYNPNSLDLYPMSNPEEIIRSNTLSGRIAWMLTEEPFMKSVRDVMSLARFSFSAGQTRTQEDCGLYGLNMEGGLALGFMENRLRFGARMFRNSSVHNEVMPTSMGYFAFPLDWDVKGWSASLSWHDVVKAGNHNLSYGVSTDIWDAEYHRSLDTYPDMLQAGQIHGYVSGIDPDHMELGVIGDSTPRYHFNFGLSVNYAGFGLEALFHGVGKCDWAPNALYDDLFFGVSSTGRGPGLILEKFRNVEYRSDAAPDAYWVKEFPWGVSYTPLGYFVQNASFLRLKHLRLDYTFEGGALDKSLIRSICVFCEGRNLFYVSPMRRYAPDIDPEAVYISLKTGAGDGYPLLRTVEVGVSVRF